MLENSSVDLFMFWTFEYSFSVDWQNHYYVNYTTEFINYLQYKMRYLIDVCNINVLLHSKILVKSKNISVSLYMEL